MQQTSSKEFVSWRYFAQIVLLAFLCINLSGCGIITIGGDLVTILNRLSRYYQNFIDLTIAFGYLAGVLFVMKALFAFKVYGEQRTMMSTQTSIRIPLTYLAVGMALLFMPSMVSIMSQSFFMTPTVGIIGYTNNTGDVFNDVKTNVYALIQVFGVISFVRGWFLISHTQGAQGSIGKGVTHIMAGIVGININTFATIINNSLGT